ncbi:MAG: winged helix-turn-helix transcriptional regulator [Candidatus Thorarchaeota archaeon]
MNRRFTKRILIGLSFLLLTWSIIGVALASSGIGEAESVALDFSPSLNANDEMKSLDLYSFMISSATSVVNISLDVLLTSWNSGGTNTAWSNALYSTIETGFIALAIGTVSIDRREDRRIQKLRDRVAFEVAANPGIHLRELHRIIGCAMGALQYHLRFLEQDGQVISLRVGNVRHIFSPDYSTDENVMRLTAIARNPTIGSILTECAKNGQTTQAEISRTLEVDKSLVSYYISGLLKADILRSVKVFGREKPVILTDWARSAIDVQGILVQ